MNTYNLRRTFLILVWILGSSWHLLASSLRLGTPFQEHMVLQQKMPLTIWGEAIPNAVVTIRFAKEKTQVRANAQGDWKAILPQQPAGGPFLFEVVSEKERIAFTDVLVGEVWICSGQSNMVMPYKGIANIEALKPTAKDIRTLHIENTVSFDEEKYAGGEWKVSNPASAVAFSFAYFLQQAANVPIGIIQVAWGSSSLEGWMSRDLTAQLPHFAQVMNDFDRDKAMRERIDSILAKGKKRNTKEDILLRTQPNILYNAMMKPLAPLTVRGLVWYQGEANAKSIESMLQYGTSLPIWIKHIRQEFQNENMYFLGVMLPGFKGLIDLNAEGESALDDANNPSWAWMRESQLKALDLPHASVATTIDLGDKNNIHPSDKLPVGQRLALLAQKNTLRLKVLEEGPVFKNFKREKNSLVIRFYNSRGLKTTDGKDPEAFWIADASGKWVKAQAEIKEGKVHVSAKSIVNPRYVRYAFSSKPKVNLVNDSGLPARPFRTDPFKPR